MGLSKSDGIDVSHHNGIIDWSAVVSTGIGFAYAKATEGTSVQDSQFQVNYAAIRANGILRGAYHFFHPGADPIEQADNFLAMAKLLPGDLPPVLDIEVNDGQTAEIIVDRLADWLDKIEQALGRTPMIYTSAGFWIGNLAGSKAFTRYPLWVAHYTTRPTPALPPGFSNYVVWQYSELGQIAGVVGTVDLDRFNGTADDLTNFAAS